MGRTFAPSVPDVTLGRGKVLFKRSTAGGSTVSYLNLGNVSKLEVTPSDDVAELYNYMDPTGGLYAAALKRRKVEIALEFWEWDEDNLSAAVIGDVSYVTQSGGSITAESLSTSGQLGDVYQTANLNPSAIVVKSGATTLVLGTDYEIQDASLALIHILPTASVNFTVGSAVTTNYTAPAIVSPNQPAISLFNRPQLDGTLLFAGNPAVGKVVKMVLYHVRLFAKKVGGFVSDDFASNELNGRVLWDAAGTYGGSAAFPYGKIWTFGNQ